MIAIPQFISFDDDIKISVTKEKLVSFKRAITGDARQISGGQYLSLGFEINLGVLPTALADLIAQGGYVDYNPYTKKGWRGPYVSSVDTDWDKDAWGNAIIYSAIGRSLTSPGPDGVSSTGDDIIVTF